MHSEQIDKLAAALAKAESEIEGAKKSGKNPFFKSEYAGLEDVWHACRDQLTKNGIAISQLPTLIDDKFVLVTMLMHSSGQWLKSIFPINPIKHDPQSLGSAITYARRYSLKGMVSMPDLDDDAEHAMARDEKPAQQAKQPSPTSKEVQEQFKIMELGQLIFDVGPNKGKTFKEVAFNDKERAKEYVKGIRSVIKEKGVANLQQDLRKFNEYMTHLGV